MVPQHLLLLLPPFATHRSTTVPEVPGPKRVDLWAPGSCERIKAPDVDAVAVRGIEEEEEEGTR